MTVTAIVPVDPFYRRLITGLQPQVADRVLYSVFRATHATRHPLARIKRVKRRMVISEGVLSPVIGSFTRFPFVYSVVRQQTFPLSEIQAIIAETRIALPFLGEFQTVHLIIWNAATQEFFYGGRLGDMLEEVIRFEAF